MSNTDDQPHDRPQAVDKNATTARQLPPAEPKKRLSLAKQILIALVIGTLTGLTFGEGCAILQPIGDGFIRLLQMTILPFIMVSLIQGIGGLRSDEATRLAYRGGAMLGLSWLVTLVVVLTLPLAFPVWDSASFFSTTLIEEPAPVDFLSIYIPSNPFFSMANSLIPAVVLFCIMLGIALIAHPKKAGLIEQMKIIADSLTTVTNLIVKLTPFGVFALVASAAGTMSLGEIMRIQVYVVSFIVACLMLTFVILPLMISALTPFSYGKVLKLTQSALITGFTTGNLFVILPSLIEAAKQLFRDVGDDSEQTMTYVDVLVPVSFNFPNAGKLVMLLFICFAAWFNGGSIGPADYPTFVVSGLLSFFGSVNIAVPFLLSSFNLPADLFQLFVVSGIITGYFATLLAAMSLFTITVLGTAAMTGNVTISKARIGRWCASSAIALVCTTVGLGLYFNYMTDNDYERSEIINRMHSRIVSDQVVIIHTVPPQIEALDQRPIRERIASGGEVRIAYAPDRLPFSFENDRGELVGFDIDMAMDFAKHLSCTLALVPATAGNIQELLDTGVVDAAFATVGISGRRELIGDFCDPVMDLTTAVAVRDARKDDFATLAEIRAQQPLKIATDMGDFFTVSFKDALPHSELVPVDGMRSFFDGDVNAYDGILGPAEILSAWTLLYPQYTVVVPKPSPYRFPAGYFVANGNDELRKVINAWLLAIKQHRRYAVLYDHWILGQGAEDKQPRWCLVRNVFGWVD